MGVQNEARDALGPPPGESDWSVLWARGELLFPARCPVSAASELWEGARASSRGWGVLCRDILEASGRLMVPLARRSPCLTAGFTLLTLRGRGPIAYGQQDWNSDLQITK